MVEQLQLSEQRRRLKTYARGRSPAPGWLLLCIAAAATTLVSFSTSGADLKKQETGYNLPGGIAVLPITVVVDDGTTPLVRFGRQKVLLLRETSRWLAVVGISRSIVPGDYIVTSGVGKADAVNYRFRVRPNPDTAQQPNVDPQYVSLLGYDESRFARLPLKTPGFGEIRKHFSVNFPAMEIETKDAASIVSPGDGVIHSVTPSGPVGDQVIINHGQGVYSVLSPVYDLRARVDEEVVQSQILGVTGAMTAGAVSGVRWKLVLNSTLIDPASLLYWPTPPAPD